MNSAISLPRRALDRVWRSRFARNVAVVASGAAGAQAITMAFAPLITRIYGPEAFGLLGTFMAIVAVAVPVAALAYPIAIVLPRDDRDALGLVRLSVILSFAVALLAAAGLWAGGDWLTATLGAESVAGFLFLVPLAMLFAAWMQIAQQWLIRKKEFGVVARSAVAHSLILNTAKSGIGWLHPVGVVLIVLATLGQALHAGLLFTGALRRYQGITAERDEGPGTPLKELAHRHRDFPLYRAPQNAIYALSQALPILLLAALFGPAAAGFYALAKLVMGPPALLLGKAVSDVFYPKITEATHEGRDVGPMLLKATGILAIVGLAPVVVVVVLGPSLFVFVFGSDWVVSGDYARWLALFYLFNLINRPCFSVIPVFGAQRGFLLYEVLTLIFKALALVAGYKLFDSDIWAVALFSLAGVVSYSLVTLWVIWLSLYRMQHV